MNGNALGLLTMLANGDELTREEHQKLDWKTHGVDIDNYGTDNERPQEYYDDHFNNLYSFIAFGWTKDEVQRYMLQHRLSPNIYLYNIHTDCGDYKHEGRQITAAKIFHHRVSEEGGHNDAIRRIRKKMASAQLTLPGRRRVVVNRVATERCRRALPAATAHVAHPALA